MRRLLIFASLFGGIFVMGMNIVRPGPAYPPTKGEVWPKPQQQTSEENYFTYEPDIIHFKITGFKCFVLEYALSRYRFKLAMLHETLTSIKRKIKNLISEKTEDINDDKFMGNLTDVEVELTSPCDDYPHYDMVESYNLTISTRSQLKSTSIWGILRGLETLTHLLYFSDDYCQMRINITDIVDYPQYAHRGLLLDTGRHYLSVSTIMRILELMKINKMNVLHWHIVDDQSFPYVSEAFPELSRRGAFHPILTYSNRDINKIVDYARVRGIRVIPEFDVPGHTRSWGVAYPNLLTECYNKEEVIGLGPMDPTNNSTYKLLQTLFQEVQGLFPDKYFHIGGDEVELQCWESNPNLVEYMKQHNMTSASELHALFMREVIPLLGNRSTPIVWQEVFDEEVPLSPDTIVQVWKGNSVSEMTKILSSGHKVIFSSAWYLDHLKSGGDWVDFYKADPRSWVSQTNSNINLNNIVGGEACMWGEVVDDSNVMDRIWPRASAVAEKLWSSNTSNFPDETVYRRLEEHTCRMKIFGYKAQPPNGPGFCLTIYS